jgi:uncharacterized membrane protein YfcA
MISKKYIFPIWIALVFCVWLALLLTGPGFALFKTHWVYSLMMTFGAAIAGYTPEGGGAVAYPILSLYFKITPPIARDFSLAIQAIGMVSASIYIIFNKKRDWSFYRFIPLYAGLNFVGFIIVSALFSNLAFTTFQMLFVCLAFAFIISFWITKTYGTKDNFIPDTFRKIVATSVFCFLGGGASAMFGTGADMFLYILLSVYYGVKEKEGTDLSIILMATVSVFGIFYRGIILNEVDGSVYYMWLATVPVVVLFAPFGNMLLKVFKKERMLLFVLLLNGFNLLFWLYKNPSLFINAFICLLIFVTFFTGSFIFRKRSRDI